MNKMLVFFHRTNMLCKVPAYPLNAKTHYMAVLPILKNAVSETLVNNIDTDLGLKASIIMQ